MSHATNILRKEHDAILQMLDAALQAARRLERSQPVEPALLNDLLEFFQLFADKCHHGKEEELLFPLLEKKGMPRAGGPVGVMLHEHELGRSLIAEMKTAAEVYGVGDIAAGPRWALAARKYADLLGHHIHKENEVLFVMAERMLSAAEQQELAEAFEKLEEEKMGPGTHQRLHAQMEKLLAQLAPAATSR
ncbi:MAG: hemerythrin domain-containing protein [Candidatus Acidiferrales bacterium]